MFVLQGLTYTEAPHAQPAAWAALQSDNTATKLPGGESLDQLRERLTAAVLDIARWHPGDCCFIAWLMWQLSLCTTGPRLLRRLVGSSVAEAVRPCWPLCINHVLAYMGAICRLDFDRLMITLAVGAFSQWLPACLPTRPLVCLPAGQRVVIISHGGALHSLHRAARGYQAKGKVFNCSISVLLAEADAAATSADSNGQHTQHAHPHADGQSPHLDPVNPAAVNLKVVESDADHVAVVWCDAAELCDHCSSSEDIHASSSHGDTAASTDTHADGAVCSLSGTHSAGDTVSTAAEGQPAAIRRQGSKSSSGKGGMKQCGGGRVKGGRLALLSWNDSYALQAAHLQSDKAFGGSSRAG